MLSRISSLITILFLASNAFAQSPQTALLDGCDIRGQTITLIQDSQLYCDADIQASGARVITNGHRLDIVTPNALVMKGQGLIITASPTSQTLANSENIYISAMTATGRLQIDNHATDLNGGDVTLEFMGVASDYEQFISVSEGSAVYLTVDGNLLQTTGPLNTIPRN